jgi:hypothetical protein
VVDVHRVPVGAGVPTDVVVHVAEADLLAQPLGRLDRLLPGVGAGPG